MKNDIHHLADVITMTTVNSHSSVTVTAPQLSEVMSTPATDRSSDDGRIEKSPYKHRAVDIIDGIAFQQFASEVEMVYYSNHETQPSRDDQFFGFDVKNRPSTALMEFISSHPKNPGPVTDHVSSNDALYPSGRTSGLVRNSEQCSEQESIERCVVDIIDGIEIQQFTSEVDMEFHTNHEALPSLDETFYGFDVQKKPSTVVMDFFNSQVKKQQMNSEHSIIDPPQSVPAVTTSTSNTTALAAIKPFVRNEVEDDDCVIVYSGLKGPIRTFYCQCRKTKRKSLVPMEIISLDSDDEDAVSTSNSSYGCSTTANVDNSNRISENHTATNICRTNINNNYVESKEGSSHNITSHSKNFKKSSKRTNIDYYKNSEKPTAISRTKICNNLNSQKGRKNSKRAKIDSDNLFLENHNVKTQKGANHIATNNGRLKRAKICNYNRTLKNRPTTNISRTNTNNKNSTEGNDRIFDFDKNDLDSEKHSGTLSNNDNVTYKEDTNRNSTPNIEYSCTKRGHYEEPKATASASSNNPEIEVDTSSKRDTDSVLNQRNGKYNFQRKLFNNSEASLTVDSTPQSSYLSQHTEIEGVLRHVVDFVCRQEDIAKIPELMEPYESFSVTPGFRQSTSSCRSASCTMGCICYSIKMSYERKRCGQYCMFGCVCSYVLKPRRSSANRNVYVNCEENPRIIKKRKSKRSKSLGHHITSRDDPSEDSIQTESYRTDLTVDIPIPDFALTCLTPGIGYVPLEEFGSSILRLRDPFNPSSSNVFCSVSLATMWLNRRITEHADIDEGVVLNWCVGNSIMIERKKIKRFDKNLLLDSRCKITKHGVIFV